MSESELFPHLLLICFFDIQYGLTYEGLNPVFYTKTGMSNIYVIFAGSSSAESDHESYEVIETNGAARSIIEELISLDLANRSNVQQLCIGGASGW